MQETLRRDSKRNFGAEIQDRNSESPPCRKERDKGEATESRKADSSVGRNDKSVEYFNFAQDGKSLN